MLVNPISETLSVIWPLLQTNFITALAGAGAGALGAQFITEKIKNKESLLKEIRNVNSAISIANHMCLLFLGTKHGNSKPIYEEFFRDRNILIQILESGQAIEIFDYQRDCTFIPVPQVHFKSLRKILFNQLSLDEKAVTAYVYLEQSFKSFSLALNKRNKITDDYLLRFKKLSLDGKNEETMNYFGLEHNGSQNKLHLDFVKRIMLRNNDCIFLVLFLIGELIKHGKYLNKKYGEDAPEIFEPNFSDAIRMNLIPFEKRYENWEFN